MKMQHENQRPMPDTSATIKDSPPRGASECEPGFTPPTTKMPKNQMAAPTKHPACGDMEYGS